MHVYMLDYRKTTGQILNENKKKIMVKLDKLRKY